MFWETIDSNSEFKTGTYRLTFAVPAFLPLPTVNVPKSYEFANYKFTLSEFLVNNTARTVVAVLRIESTTAQSPAVGSSLLPVAIAGIPIGTVLLVVGILTGLGLVAYSLTKIERLTESPSGSVFVLAIAAAVAAAIYKMVKA